jgi:menaquinone-9 beta-reductase
MRNGRATPHRVGSACGSGRYLRAVPPAADVQVLVVGAGPAGIAAGLEARRLGLDVLVVDRAEFPRDKTCGDGLTTGALRILDRLGLDVRTLPSYAPVSETVLVSPAGREVVVPLPGGGEYACVVPRVELDAALVDIARASGVEVWEHARVVDARDDGDAVTVTFADDTTLRVAWVIAADGHYSAVRRLLARSPGAVDADDSSGAAADPPARSPGSLGTWHAFRQYYSGVEDRRLWVLFERDFLPGYAWVFPVGDGRANVGFGVLRDARHGDPRGVPSGKALAAQWRDLADRPSVRRALGPHATPEGTHRAWPIPADYDRARLARGRALFVGDAASVVDPMTGEGIAQALETGALAAAAIAGAPHDVTAVGTRYRDEVDRALGADLRFASVLQRVLQFPLGARAALGAAALTPWTRRNFARWMFEDYPRALVLTPRRWRHDMFTRPGAYASSGVTASGVTTSGARPTAAVDDGAM